MRIDMVRLLQSGLRRGFSRIDAAMNRLYGWKHNPIYYSGALSVALLIVLIATGVYLLLFYRLGSPYASMERITGQAWLGRWIRSLHRYSADAALVAAAVHGLRAFARRKSWGPRALAWVSGLIMVFFFFLCAWTGCVLVWDTHALVIAAAGARLLDLLPVFSEPLGRTFVGEQPIPSAFFFVNFFLHVALPLAMGLLLWIHAAHVARPALLPPRPLLWGSVGVLFAVSVFWPIGMAPEADLLRVPDGVPLDLFYGFWIPLTTGVPAAVVWGIFLALAGALLLAPLWSRPATPSRPLPSVVDEAVCTGCEQCYHDCPYEAISMVDRVDGRAGMVARVDPDLCVSCGICAGSCAPMVVGPPGRSGRDQLAQVRVNLAQRAPAPAEIVVIACARSAGELALRDTGQGIRLHPVSCVGTVHTSVVEQYVRAGAAGVLVIACPPNDCWNREGAKWAEQRLFHGREAELKERVDRQRVHLAYAAEAESDHVLEELARFRARLEPGSGPGGDELDLIALCDRDPETEAV
jgi:coenzyme F420-reducing hydrogenase delta subunit/Pyruvate/2-oxoacid:ferredoxin oxidoreductase delta subunit